MDCTNRNRESEQRKDITLIIVTRCLSAFLIFSAFFLKKKKYFKNLVFITQLWQCDALRFKYYCFHYLTALLFKIIFTQWKDTQIIQPDCKSITQLLASLQEQLLSDYKHPHTFPLLWTLLNLYFRSFQKWKADTLLALNYSSRNPKHSWQFLSEHCSRERQLSRWLVLNLPFSLQRTKDNLNKWEVSSEGVSGSAHVASVKRHWSSIRQVSQKKQVPW